MSAGHEVNPPRHWVAVNGIPTYLHGCNYPWTRGYDGKSNYGLDFGVNLWGTHEGVSTRQELVRRDFLEMRALGFNVVRWFVFCDGRGGVKFDENLLPVAPTSRFYEDMDCALSVAEEVGLAVVFVLFNHSWLFDTVRDSDGRPVLLKGHPGLFRTEKGQVALYRNLCLPLVERYGSHPQILAWEVMNEPDFVIRELDCAPEAKRSAMSIAEFERFVRLIAGAVHAHTSHRVTIGGGRVKNVRIWDDEKWELDLLQVHSYNDFIHAPWDRVLYGSHVETHRLGKPLVIGEFPGDWESFRSVAERLSPNTAHLPAPTLMEYLDFAVDDGYAGAWAWSFKGVDACGAPNKNILRTWASSRGASLRLPLVSPLAWQQGLS